LFVSKLDFCCGCGTALHSVCTRLFVHGALFMGVWCSGLRTAPCGRCVLTKAYQTSASSSAAAWFDGTSFTRPRPTATLVKTASRQQLCRSTRLASDPRQCCAASPQPTQRVPVTALHPPARDAHCRCCTTPSRLIRRLRTVLAIQHSQLSCPAWARQQSGQCHAARHLALLRRAA
jgi:hypothetical protein